MATVNNFFKSVDEAQRRKNLCIKLANMVCRCENGDNVRYSVDINKLPSLCCDFKKND